MNIDIQSLEFPITGALAGHARRRLRFVLTRRSDRIQVRLFNAPVAVIEEVGTEPYAVIDRTTGRVSRVVVKHLGRLRSGRRYGRGGATASPPTHNGAGGGPPTKTKPRA